MIHCATPPSTRKSTGRGHYVLLCRQWLWGIIMMLCILSANNNGSQSGQGRHARKFVMTVGNGWMSLIVFPDFGALSFTTFILSRFWVLVLNCFIFFKRMWSRCCMNNSYFSLSIIRFHVLQDHFELYVSLEYLPFFPFLPKTGYLPS